MKSKLKLTKKQIVQLKVDPTIKATIQTTVEVNQAAAAKARDEALVLLGYNEALLDNHAWPQGHTSATWRDVIEMQKAKLGIS